MEKTKLILIGLVIVYGLYIIMRNLFSGDISKIIYVVIGVPLIWFISGEQARKRKEKEHKKKLQTKNSQNADIPVDVIGGVWICPACKEKNNKLYDICEKCGQPVMKE
jgi:uncharacterized membrane protein YuzA (DUF378 family)